VGFIGKACGSGILISSPWTVHDTIAVQGLRDGPEGETAIFWDPPSKAYIRESVACISITHAFYFLKSFNPCSIAEGLSRIMDAISAMIA
jgi:hypothetical protein